MAKSYITLTFDNTQKINNDEIDIFITNLDDDLGISLNEKYKVSGRISNYTLATNPSGIPLLNPTLGQKYAIDFAKFIQLDYLSLNLFDVTNTLNSVTLTAKEDNWSFLGADLPNGIIADIFESTYQPKTFSIIEDIIYESDIDKCNKFKLSLETSLIANSIRLNDIVVSLNNTNNPFELEINRDIPFTIKLFNNASNEELIYKNLKGVSSININNINIIINNSLIGSTVIVNVKNELYGLILEYSLDNINWTTNNVFTGQSQGEYTLFIRDQYGCKKQLNYIIDAFGTREPFFFLSKANGINFSEQVNFNNVDTFENDENTLSFQSLSNIRYCEPILYNIGDKPKIQFKSNYSEIICLLRKEDLTYSNLIINKKTANLNRYESLDAIYYKYDVDLLGIYFENGKKYNNLGIENGEYNLSGNLPDFAIIGQYIGLNGLGYFKIVDILFDSNIGKKVIIINYNYNGLPVSTIVESKYDLLNYEIYEIELDFTNFEVGCVDLLLTNSDITNGTIYHLSENIYLKQNHNETLHIMYYNDNNRDIFYKYGIKHFIRVLYSTIIGGIEDESEVNKGDLTVVLNNSYIREINKFLFTDLTTERMRTLAIALSCKNVFINGCGYVKLELTINSIEGTNLHDLEAKMIKTNINYNNNRQGQTGVDEDYVLFNIPALIKSGNGFIKS